MNKIIFASIVIAVLFSAISYSQSGWYAVTDSVPDLYMYGLQFTSANTGYACGEYSNLSTGVFLKTTNAGLNWQRTEYVTHSADFLCFLNDLTGYFVGYAFRDMNKGFIFKTTDGAASWCRQDSIDYGNFFGIKFYDINTGLVAGKYGQAYFTSNGGVNWNNTGTFYMWVEPQCIWCFDANKWLVGDGGSITKTTNQGINWIKDDSSNATSMYFINNTTGFMTIYYGSVYKSTNSGNNWFKIFDGNINSFYPNSLIFTNSNTGYMCGYNSGSVFKTTNGGYNWAEQHIVTNNSFYEMSFINENTGFVSGNYGRIYKTTNGGSVFVSNISGEVPEKFELSQNYPNPFNQSSIINFKCKIKGVVSLKVFDVSGREVQSLVNETLSPGTYQVRFDGSGLSSGIYYYKLSVDNRQISVKKMVLMK